MGVFSDKTDRFYIGEIPAILWGKQSDKIYIYVHGQNGCKEEAEAFAQVATAKGWQVISFDLPGHGNRPTLSISLFPGDVVPELEQVYEYVCARFKRIAIFGNSAGAYFSMLTYNEKPLEHALFVSPLLDMEKYIRDAMKRAGVTKERLYAEQVIPTDFGVTLTWKYFKYVSDNPLGEWTIPTYILYPGRDLVTPFAVVENFLSRVPAELTIYPEGEHWFHTEKQLEVLKAWAEKHLAE